MAQPGGVLNRAGHTEAASDLALLAGLEPAGVLVEILNADGSMARRPELEAFAREHGLKIGSIEELIRYRLATEHTVERVDERDIDTEHGPFRLRHLPRPPQPRAAFRAGARRRPTRPTPTLVRVHVQNPLADALHWRRADFGAGGGRGAGRDRRARAAARWCCWASHADADALLARIRASSPSDEPAPGHALAEWRRNGAGAQILADLGPGQAARARHAAPAGRPGRLRAGSRRVRRA